MSVLSVEDLDRATIEEQSKGVVEAERQCKITLSSTAPRAISLDWHIGRGGRLTSIALKPGASVVQPLSKAQVWFGPFSVPSQFATAVDERERDRLRLFWQQEKARYLNRYDYERPPSVSKGGYEPIGPHRSPDVTVTIIEADGTEGAPIRLHELYKIGEWDPLKEQFGKRETPEQIEARHRAELDGISAKYEEETAALRRQMAEMAGMVKGLAVTAAGGK